MHDIIIGAGPAGISAAIYAVSRGQKTLVIEKVAVGGLIGKVSTVTHYAAVMEGETGKSFAERLNVQARNAGVEIIKAEVDGVELDGNVKKFIQIAEHIVHVRLYWQMAHLQENLAFMAKQNFLKRVWQ